MTAALRLENVITEVGPGAITHAFFSTVSALLEPEGWGTRFPALMNKLYQGALPEADAAAALKEIEDVVSALKEFSVDRLVWDIEQENLTGC